MQNLEKETQAVFERAKDAVVQIKTIVPVKDVQKGEVVGEGLSAGTGFFIDNKGLILTAASVLRGSEKAVVYWGGKSYEGQSLGQDDRTNVALVRIDATTPCLPVGDPEVLKAASVSMVVGYGVDGPASAECGFISDPDSTGMPKVFAVTHIRTSVRSRPGQSGSPLLNSKGEVVGMVVYATEDFGSTFALPITAARKIQRDLVEHHAPRHGWTGLTIEVPASDLQNTQKKIAIRDVYSGCSAHQAGIRSGDVLKKIGNKTIQTPADVMNATFYLSVGEMVNFIVERKGETLTLPVKVMPRPSEKEYLALKPVPASSP
jgi:serine protease Do